ncbi:hypothetical protein AAC387_Pa09g1247 [Persea americana]
MGRDGTPAAFSDNGVVVAAERFIPFSVLFFSSLPFCFCSKGTSLAPSSSGEVSCLPSSTNGDDNRVPQILAREALNSRGHGCSEYMRNSVKLLLIELFFILNL